MVYSLMLGELKKQAAETLMAANDLYSVADKEDRGLTAEEQGRFTDLMAKHNELVADVERREKLECAKAAAESSERQTTPSQPEKSTAVIPASRIEVSHYHASSLKAYKSTEVAYRMGRWMMAALYNHGQSRDWCADHGIELRYQAGNVDAKGGFAVPDEMYDRVIDLREKYGVTRQNADVWTMASDTLLIPIIRHDAGPTAAFVGEGQAWTASDITFAQAQLTARKLMALVQMTSEVAEDAIIDIAEKVTDRIAWSFAKKEDECAFIGTGAALYGGIIGVTIAVVDGTHDASYVTAATNHDTAPEYDVADLAALMMQLPSYAKANAKFYCHPGLVHGTFDRIKAASSGTSGRELSEGNYQNTYLGYPIVEVPCMNDAVAASTAIDIMFGDLSQAVVFGDKKGMSVRADSSRYAEYDMVGIFAKERFDINPHSMGTNTVAGPLVALQAH